MSLFFAMKLTGTILLLAGAVYALFCYLRGPLRLDRFAGFTALGLFLLAAGLAWATYIQWMAERPLP
jgi:hypothetical protein